MNVLSAAMSPSTGRAKPGGRRASQYPAARALPMRPAHATWAGSQVSSVADRTLEMWVPRERWMPARGGEEKRCEGREREREREREGEAGPGALRNERGRGGRGPSLPSSRLFLSLGWPPPRRPPQPPTPFSLLQTTGPPLSPPAPPPPPPPPRTQRTTAVQADKDAQVDGRPGRPARAALGAPPVGFLFEEGHQRPARRVGLGGRHAGLVVGGHAGWEEKRGVCWARGGRQGRGRVVGWGLPDAPCLVFLDAPCLTPGKGASQVCARG